MYREAIKPPNSYFILDNIPWNRICQSMDIIGRKSSLELTPVDSDGRSIWNLNSSDCDYCPARASSSSPSLESCEASEASSVTVLSTPQPVGLGGPEPTFLAQCLAKSQRDGEGCEERSTRKTVPPAIGQPVTAPSKSQQPKPGTSFRVARALLFDSQYNGEGDSWYSQVDRIARSLYQGRSPWRTSNMMSSYSGGSSGRDAYVTYKALMLWDYQDCIEVFGLDGRSFRRRFPQCVGL